MPRGVYTRKIFLKKTEEDYKEELRQKEEAINQLVRVHSQREVQLMDKVKIQQEIINLLLEKI